MPFNVDPAQALQADPQKLQQSVPLGLSRVSFTDQMGAAFSLGNTIVSAANFASREATPPPEDNFDPLKNLAPGEELVAHEFAEAKSSGEMAQIRDSLEKRREMARRLGSGPVPEFLAQSLAILADPTTYIPYMGEAATAGKLSRAATIGIETAFQQSLQEGILQGTQRGRPIEESVAAVIMGGAFGAGLGVAGAAVAARRAKAYDAAVKDYTTLIRSAAEDTGTPFPARPEAVGAGVPARLAPEDTRLVSSLKSAEIAASLDKIHLAAPSVVLASSENAATREAVHALVDTGLVTEGHLKGIPMSKEPPVELIIKGQTETGIVSLSRILGSQFNDFRSAGGTMTRMEFNEAVGKAMRRGDVDAVPQVQKAAETIREKIHEPLKKGAIDTKQLPPDVKPETATSYFTRVYDKAKIKARWPEARAIVEAYLQKTIPLDELATKAEYKEIAEAILGRIVNHSQGRVPYFPIPRLRGPMKERTFNIPDEMIEPFLIHDAQRVTGQYIHTMVSDIEMARLSQRLGFGGRADDVGAKLGEKIMEEAKAAVEAATTEAERTGIFKKAERDKELIEGLVEQIRGTSRGPEGDALGFKRVGKVVRTLNYLRSLGSVIVSQLPDMGNLVMKEGLASSFGTFMADAFNGFKGIRLSMKEAQMAGTANDIALATTVRAQFDIGERYATDTAFERGLDKTAQWFGLATLATPWTQYIKGLTSAVVSTRILEAVQKIGAGGKASARDVSKLAQAGIDEAMAKRIAAQAEHFDNHGMVTIANTEAWKDGGAVEAFRLALLRDVNNAIITPGAADAPLWTSTEWGKTIFQFKRFSAASTQRILISGLQNRDMASLNGLLLMVAAGGLGTVMREYATGGEVKPRTGASWVAEAVDRSGAMSMFFEMDALADKLTAGNLSLQGTLAGRGKVAGALGIEPAQGVSRFQNRDVLGQLLGPTAGAVSDFGSAVQGLADKDLTQSDLHKVRRLVPGQNILWLRAAIDKVEKNIAQRYDIPAKAAGARKSQGAKRVPNLPGG